MCRWITLISTDEMSMAAVVLNPSNSLVDQSVDASYHPGFPSKYNHTINADGFGVGWYHQRSPFPAVFKDTQPAWSNVNLQEICEATETSCLIAHVRAASPGMGVHLPNVHPFKAGRLLFCHNGAIKGFSTIKRKIMAQLTDEAFTHMKGTTDSECAFALLLTNLSKDGQGKVSPFEQTEPFGEDRLYSAMKRTIRQLEHVLQMANIPELFVDPTRMNFALTDGDTVICSRFCDRYPKVAPPSLYFCYGHASLIQEVLCNPDMMENESQDGSATDADSDWTDSDHHDAIEQDLSQQSSLPGTLLSQVDPSKSALIVSSDPLTKVNSELSWHPMAANSILCYTRGHKPHLYKLKVGGAKRPEDYAFFLVD